MSMIGNFRLVEAQELERLLAEPEAIENLLCADDDEAGDGAPDSTQLDIDKAWHGLHFLFTGTAWEGKPPLNFIAGGGQEVGDVDVGYGPARAFTSAEVKEISAALTGLSTADLRKRFDPAKMMKLQIYPEIWDRDAADDDTLAYLLEYFEQLKAFLAHGAERNFALLVYLN